MKVEVPSGMLQEPLISLKELVAWDKVKPLKVEVPLDVAGTYNSSHRFLIFSFLLTQSGIIMLFGVKLSSSLCRMW